LQVNWLCRPGELVTGMNVAWEADPNDASKNLATGIRVYCENPLTACGPLPSPTPPPAPPPVSPPPPVRRNGWSDWFGRQTNQNSVGICPCGTWINVRWCRRLSVCMQAGCLMPADWRTSAAHHLPICLAWAICCGLYAWCDLAFPLPCVRAELESVV
jgi:hypothetical protein